MFEGEAEVVARARRDRRAFAPLYARYLDPVYRYCYRRLGSREAAEDATAQVFCQAMGGLGGFRDGPFRAWLFAIARNVVADQARRRRPCQPLDGIGEALVDRAPTPEQVALAGEAGVAVRRLLAGLPKAQRRVVELRLAGLTGAEVARALGRSVGAVKMLQLRAAARLRPVLARKEVQDAGL